MCVPLVGREGGDGAREGGRRGKEKVLFSPKEHSNDGGDDGRKWCEPTRYDQHLLTTAEEEEEREVNS